MLIAPTAAALQPYVEGYWAQAARAPRPGARERVLPCGRLHLAFRLDGEGLRLYADAADRHGQRIAHAVVAGARAQPYVKDVSESSRSVGVLLRPGAARALLGCSAEEIGPRHLALDAVWGEDAARLQHDLADARSPQRQIALLQQWLLRRLRPVRAVHPPVAQAIAALQRGGGIAPLVRASGCSHKRFIALFREATGLSPKCYARVQRLQQALQLPAASDWSGLALAADYSDQAHLCREFRTLTGLTPQAWRRSATASAHHVALATDNFLQDAGDASD